MNDKTPIRANCIPKPPAPRVDVILELTMAQAEFLRNLLGNHIAGPSYGPRGLSDQIRAGLVAAGVPSTPRLSARSRGVFEDGVIFLEASE